MHSTISRPSSQATTQLVDQAQALHLTVQLRDKQLHEASDELESRGALITQLESQVQELQDTEMDFEEEVPQPAPVETHSPAVSEATVNV